MFLFAFTEAMSNFENFVDYKSEKFQYDYEQAEHQRKLQAPNPATFHGDITRMVFYADNCFDDLYSMWEGTIDEINVWMVTKGLMSAKLNGNKAVVKELAKHNSSLAQDVESFFAKRVEGVRQMRNELTHTKVAERTIHWPGFEMTLTDASGNSFQVYADLPGLHKEFTAFVAHVRTRLK